MYYDMYRQGFAYYAEQNSVPYSVLNAMAMKYVTTFFCRDLFFDETTITEERMSPLYKVFNVDEKKVKTKTENVSNEKNPFAKLKNYKMEQQSKDNVKGKYTDEKKKEENERPKIKNKFISLGKTYNFSDMTSSHLLPSTIFCLSSLVSCLPSPAPSLVSHLLPIFSRFLSLTSHLLSLISRLLSIISCFPSPVSCLPSLISPLPYPTSRL